MGPHGWCVHISGARNQNVIGQKMIFGVCISSAKVELDFRALDRVRNTVQTLEAKLGLHFNEKCRSSTLMSFFNLDAHTPPEQITTEANRISICEIHIMLLI